MKKILHINSQSETIWWMERYIENFYDWLKNNFDINLLKLNKWINNLKIENDRIFSFEKEITNSLEWKIKLIFLILSNKITKLCKKEKICFSISHWEVCNILNVFSKLLWNKSKVFLIIHSTISKETVWSITYFIAKIFYRYADKIICVSKELENDIQKDLNIKKDKIITIYNPFDYSKIEELKNENIENEIQNNISKNNINFCHIARLESYKKQDLLIDYFYEFKKIKNKNCKFFIIWEWNFKQLLLEKIKKLKLENDIFILGFKNNIYKYINKMDFFLYLSWLQEWFWRTLIDSLSCWIPILSHDYKYWAKEIIRNNDDLSECEQIEIHENWILTPYMDKENFIEAMDLITKTTFDKEKIKSNIKKYNIENFTKNWELTLNKK